MFNNSFELAVEVNGRSIPEFGHKGRTYVEGRKNHRYALKFRNSRAERVLVVPTVDGLNVIDGDPNKDSSPGYVVPPYSSMTITGWRKSLSEVNLFEFTDRSGSYAGATHGAQNCGVIGAQVWGEQRHYVLNLAPPPNVHIHQHQWTHPGVYTTVMDYSSGPLDTPEYSKSAGLMGSPGPIGNPGPAGSPGAPISVMYCNTLSASAPDFNLGTGYGASAVDQVSEVTFERGLWLATLEIYYSDAEGLAKDGISVSKAPALASFPRAFGGNFCKPPGC